MKPYRGDYSPTASHSYKRPASASSEKVELHIYFKVNISFPSRFPFKVGSSTKADARGRIFCDQLNQRIFNRMLLLCRVGSCRFPQRVRCGCHWYNVKIHAMPKKKSGDLVSIRTKMNDSTSGNEGDFSAMAMTDEYREWWLDPQQTERTSNRPWKNGLLYNQWAMLQVTVCSV